MQCTHSIDGSNGDPHFVRCVHPTHRRSSMGNPGAPPPALLRGRSTSTVRTRAQHPGPFGRAGGHDQMLARSWRARKAGICSRRKARHRGTPRESSARMRQGRAQLDSRRAGPAHNTTRISPRERHRQGEKTNSHGGVAVSCVNGGKSTTPFN